MVKTQLVPRLEPPRPSRNTQLRFEPYAECLNTVSVNGVVLFPKQFTRIKWVSSCSRSRELRVQSSSRGTTDPAGSPTPSCPSSSSSPARAAQPAPAAPGPAPPRKHLKIRAGNLLQVNWGYFILKPLCLCKPNLCCAAGPGPTCLVTRLGAAHRGSVPCKGRRCLPISSCGPR